jgi:methyl-accepting chemotaxis protein
VTDQFLDIEETEQDLSAEAAIEQVLEVVANAKSMPLSSSIIVSRDDVVGLLRTALERLPDELRQARWLLREREEFLAERTREAETLMEEVRAQAERMVQRTEIVRQANSVAQRILDDANDEARTMRHEAEDFCDQKLAGMEIVLDRLTRTVQSGRAKLAAVPARLHGAGEPEHAHAHAHGHTNNHAGAASTTEEDGFFDQDVS